MTRGWQPAYAWRDRRVERRLKTGGTRPWVRFTSRASDVLSRSYDLKKKGRSATYAYHVRRRQHDAMLRSARSSDDSSRCTLARQSRVRDTVLPSALANAWLYGSTCPRRRRDCNLFSRVAGLTFPNGPRDEQQWGQFFLKYSCRTSRTAAIPASPRLHIRRQSRTCVAAAERQCDAH